MSIEGKGTEGDAELVSRLKLGDERAFELLFERYSGRILAYARGMLGDGGLAEDVVQETFVSFIRSIDRVDARRGARGLLFRTARNKAIDTMRRRKLLRFGEQYEDARRTAVDVGTDVCGQVEAGDRAERVRRGLAAISGRQKEVLVLRFFGELTFEEISKVTRRQLGTVIWQAHAGLRRMREVLLGKDR